MSIEAMKLAAEFNRYFTSANGVDVPAKVSVSRDEWRALFTAIQLAEAQQPATGEPVAWIRRHPNGALSNELLTHVQVEQVRRDSGAWVPLYTHPAPSVPDDSKRLDYLQDRGATIDLIAGVAAFYPMRFRVGGLHSSANIDVRAAIDAAMLAAKDASA